MPRARSPKRDKAYQLWFDSGKKKKLKDIASDLGVSESQIRKWKKQDNWNSNVTIPKSNVTKQTNSSQSYNKAIVEDVNQVIENTELTDKQRLFCLHYVRCFNATKAYQKAYGCDYRTAQSNGYQLLTNTYIREEIMRLKQNRFNNEMLDESDIFQKYIDIAFSDVTDFVEFGQEEVPVMSMHGPVQVKDPETGKKKTLMKKVNVVRFKNSNEVDGTIISEVKQGKDGSSIKLADRMKALDWLTEHMDLATEEQKARLEQLKANTERLRRESGSEDDEGVEIINDAPKETGEDLGDHYSEVPADIQ